MGNNCVLVWTHVDLMMSFCLIQELQKLEECVGWIIKNIIILQLLTKIVLCTCMDRCELHIIGKLCVGYSIKNMEICQKIIERHKFNLVCEKIPGVPVVNTLFLGLPPKFSIATTNFKSLTSNRCVSDFFCAADFSLWDIGKIFDFYGIWYGVF